MDYNHPDLDAGKHFDAIAKSESNDEHFYNEACILVSEAREALLKIFNPLIVEMLLYSDAECEIAEYLERTDESL